MKALKSNAEALGPNYCASLFNLSEIEDYLPPWLSGREHWTIEIAHWNNTPAEDAGPKKCIVLAHQFSTGQNDTTMGHVLAQMKNELGKNFHKGAIVSLLSPKTRHSIKLDHQGCYEKLRKFLHTAAGTIDKCTSSCDPERKKYKVQLQYYLNAKETKNLKERQQTCPAGFVLGAHLEPEQQASELQAQLPTHASLSEEHAIAMTEAL